MATKAKVAKFAALLVPKCANLVVAADPLD